MKSGLNYFDCFNKDGKYENMMKLQLKIEMDTGMEIVSNVYTTYLYTKMIIIT